MPGEFILPKDNPARFAIPQYVFPTSKFFLTLWPELDTGEKTIAGVLEADTFLSDSPALIRVEHFADNVLGSRETKFILRTIDRQEEWQMSELGTAVNLDQRCLVVPQTLLNRSSAPEKVKGDDRLWAHLEFNEPQTKTLVWRRRYAVDQSESRFRGFKRLEQSFDTLDSIRQVVMDITSGNLNPR